MTTVVDKKVHGPALHAFVIGVGHYRHLPGGSGTILKNPLGLDQITEPPLSARAVLEWLTRDYYPHSEGPPLGSIELLLSQHGGYQYKGAAVDEATLPNAEAAAYSWYQKCDSRHGNVAFFYFCGHGLQRDKQYLLLEDFGQAPMNPMLLPAPYAGAEPDGRRATPSCRSVRRATRRGRRAHRSATTLAQAGS